MLKWIVYNGELVVSITLVIVFGLIFSTIKYRIINLYFEKIDQIYYHFYILLSLTNELIRVY